MRLRDDHRAPEVDDNHVVSPARKEDVDATDDESLQRRYGNPTMRFTFSVTLFYELAPLRVNTGSA